MVTDDFSQALSALLHCEHADNGIEPKNALLMYAGMRVIMSAIEAGIGWQECNDVFWSLRKRIWAGPIQFVLRDPVQQPARRTALLRNILAVPNTTTLNTSSNWLAAASDIFGCEPLVAHSSPTELGSVLIADCRNQSYYDSVAYLICRTPGNPTPKRLSECFANFHELEPVTVYTVPLFGNADNVPEWRDALVVWHLQSQNIQKSHRYLDICYSNESAGLASQIRSSLAECGIKVELSSEA